MTKTVDINETEYMGAVVTRFVDIDISNYDDDGGSDGESFVPGDVSMRRFQAVQVYVNEDTGYKAHYDEANEAIRLYETAGSSGEMAEVGSNNNNSASLKAICMGR